MKAALRRKYGRPSQIHIEEIAQPTPKDHEVLIKVKATTVNRTDGANLTGQPFIMHFVLGLFRPRKAQIGTDFAGEVVAVGAAVKNYKLGDRVFGFNDLGIGSQAEYLCLAADKVYSIPDHLSYIEAAASLEGAHYAYTFIHKANIQSGQKILVNGATGAIGSALLQFLAALDVEVDATSNTQNIPLIKTLGARQVYNFETEDFTNTKTQYDFIFDAVGKSTYGQCKKCLTPHGVYISSELGPYVQNIFLALISRFLQQKVIFPIPFPHHTTLPNIQNQLIQNHFKPVIDRSYPFHDIQAAYTYVLKGQKTGNVVLEM